MEIADMNWSLLNVDILDLIFRKVDSQGCQDWPGRKTIVAIAAVCKSWRKAMLDIAGEYSLNPRALTFPADLKVASSVREHVTQCFIIKDSRSRLVSLYLGTKPSEPRKFLMCARRCSQHVSVTDYVISLDKTSLSRNSQSCIGKLRGNNTNCKFTIIDTISTSTSTAVGSVSYAINKPKTRGPRSLTCSLHSMAANPQRINELLSDQASERRVRELNHLPYCKEIKLQSRPPEWHDGQKTWVLDFHGRVTIPSVKNFQLVDEGSDESDEDSPVLLLFGKVSRNTYTMDYRSPLSAFQAFSICLTSFDFHAGKVNSLDVY